MNATAYALTLASVAMICAGQVLFKLVGLRLTQGTVWQAGGLLLTALAIYGVATLLWVYVLRTVPLTKAYPFMALSFILVPLAGVYLFSEPVRPQYLVGVALILAGIVITVRA
jgi:drug/metabolite transporter (DMT)-like permease